MQYLKSGKRFVLGFICGGIMTLMLLMILKMAVVPDVSESVSSDRSPENAYSIQIVDHQSSDDDSWMLTLVNRWHPISEEQNISLTELRNGQAVDSRIYPYLQEMFDDARAEGILPLVYSSYRTTEMQQTLYSNKIAEYEAEGYSHREAEEQAQQWVAVPGTSEHQLGLAIDVTTENSEVQDVSVVYQWMANNSYKYGFILRYPENKTEITGIQHEPWHFRYVGREAAKEIFSQGVCLEEYLNMT